MLTGRPPTPSAKTGPGTGSASTAVGSETPIVSGTGTGTGAGTGAPAESGPGIASVAVESGPGIASVAVESGPGIASVAVETGSGTTGDSVEPPPDPWMTEYDAQVSSGIYHHVNDGMDDVEHCPPLHTPTAAPADAHATPPAGQPVPSIECMLGACKSKSEPPPVLHYCILWNYIYLVSHFA